MSHLSSFPFSLFFFNDLMTISENATEWSFNENPVQVTIVNINLDMAA